MRRVVRNGRKLILFYGTCIRTQRHRDDIILRYDPSRQHRGCEKYIVKERRRHGDSAPYQRTSKMRDCFGRIKQTASDIRNAQSQIKE